MKLKDFLYRLHKSESISKEETAEMHNTIAAIPFLTELDIHQIHPKTSYQDITLELQNSAREEYVSDLNNDDVLNPTISNLAIDQGQSVTMVSDTISTPDTNSLFIDANASTADPLNKNSSKSKSKIDFYPGEESDFVRFLKSLPPCTIPVDKPEIQTPNDEISESFLSPQSDIHQETNELIKSSLDLNQGISSESLANLWAKQGRTDLAIQMFEKLAAEYPEKSATFAVKIEKLKTDNSL